MFNKGNCLCTSDILQFALLGVISFMNYSCPQGSWRCSQLFLPASRICLFFILGSAWESKCDNNFLCIVLHFTVIQFILVLLFSFFSLLTGLQNLQFCVLHHFHIECEWWVRIISRPHWLITGLHSFLYCVFWDCNMNTSIFVPFSPSNISHIHFLNDTVF